MNITIDSGNTSTKMAFFEGGRITQLFHFESLGQAVHLLPADKNARVIISSVKQSFTELEQYFQGFIKVLRLEHNTSVPIHNKYHTPHTLGMDRLAAVVGATVKFPCEACLVIDAGSCITYDFVDEKKNYHGGSISPGIAIRFKSLHSFTARLPLIETWEDAPEARVELTGHDTSEAIRSGVINGAVAEVNGIVDAYCEKHPGIRTLICGGNANYFESKIKQPIFAIPELVHWGLNRILEHNESEV